MLDGLLATGTMGLMFDGFLVTGTSCPMLDSLLLTGLKFWVGATILAPASING